MFGTIQRWLFLKALSDVKKKRGNKKVFSNNESSSIQILYELSTEQDQKALDHFVKQLKNNQKKVVCLGFQNEKVKLSPDIIDMYSLQNVPFSQVPKENQYISFWPNPRIYLLFFVIIFMTISDM
ncbi:MAG: hypothetical protein IPG79_08565 [Saprospiraceae bacterium]|nr:hypothetical protein [Saprospiraceae bacterium]